MAPVAPPVLSLASTGSSELAPWVLGGLAVLAVVWALVQTARLALRERRVRQRLVLARAQGAAGERRAERLLARRGFRILHRQAVLRYPLGVDGVPLAVELRADFLVEDASGRYVAEVKTGSLAPRLETAATRRQLLEYRVAFDVDGVLLVDADTERVRLIEFPFRAGARAASGWRVLLALVAGLLVGAGAAEALHTPFATQPPTRHAGR